MKTFTHIPTLLALTIHVMVCGQTQESQAHKIRVDIAGNKKSTSINPKKNIGEEAKIDLLKKQVDLLNESQAKLKTSLGDLENKSLELNIEITYYQIEKNYNSYQANKQLINQKLSETKTDKEVKDNVIYFNREAEILIKIGLQMVEDAKIQLNYIAKLNELTNTNYKVIQALSIQNKALVALTEPINTETQLAFTNQEVDNSKQTINTINIVSIDNTTNNAIKQLIENANNLKQTVDEIRSNAINKPYGEATTMLLEADELEQDYFKRKIDILDVESQIAIQIYNQTKVTINQIVANLSAKTKNYSSILKLINEADFAIKIGKEMREEAKAQQSLSACFGELTNAKEQEVIAIQKQSKIKQLLPKKVSIIPIVMN